MLRSYQNEAVEALRRSFATGHRAPLLVLPTAAGKTVIFADVTRRAILKGNTALVVVHRRELVRQASTKLTEAGVPHGIIAAGTAPTPGAAVQVCSVQTVVNRLDTLGNVGLVILDEAHHAVASTWRALLAAMPQAKLLGTTATPMRLDGRGLGVHAGGLFDGLIVGATVAELTADGWLAPARVFTAAKRLNLLSVPNVGGDYAAGQLAEAVMAADLAGDAVGEYQRRADHQPAVAFCVTVQHAQATAEAFRSAGYRAACVHGGMSVAERDALIGGLGTGAVEVLCSCEILGEGVDIPTISCTILLRPTQSLALHLQQVGRGLRPAPGKSHLVVLDLAGNSIVHGLPDEPRAWSLDGEPMREREGGRARPWLCAECHCLNPAPVVQCLDCSSPKPIAERDLRVDPTAPMVEISQGDVADIARLSYRDFIAEPRTDAELYAYARARGYRRGWVWHRQQAQRTASGRQAA